MRLSAGHSCRSYHRKNVPHRPRVLVTRAPHQASELADRLRALGAEPILIPTIEITEPTSFAVLDKALADLESFDWLIFTSANAVEAFQSRKHASHDSQITTGGAPLIAAIGPATARALAAIGLAADLIPPKAVAESLADALRPQAPGARFLLVRAEEARDHIPDELRAAGGEVVVAPAYRTVIAQESVPALKKLFAESPPDAVTFTSGSSVRNLFALLEEADLCLPPTVIRASIGPITSGILEDEGYPAQVEAEEASISSLAEKTVEQVMLEERHAS